jgi:hypothetical protein
MFIIIAEMGIQISLFPCPFLCRNHHTHYKNKSIKKWHFQECHKSMHIFAFSGSSQVQISDYGNSYFLKIRKRMSMYLVGMLPLTVFTMWMDGVYWQLLFYEPLPLLCDILFLSQLYRFEFSDTL